MTVEAHLATLQQKHGALDEELRAEMSRPSAKEQLIAELKRRKLKVKDQIERLRSQMSH